MAKLTDVLTHVLTKQTRTYDEWIRLLRAENEALSYNGARKRIDGLIENGFLGIELPKLTLPLCIELNMDDLLALAAGEIPDFLRERCQDALKELSDRD